MDLLIRASVVYFGGGGPRVEFSQCGVYSVLKYRKSLRAGKMYERNPGTKCFLIIASGDKGDSEEMRRNLGL